MGVKLPAKLASVDIKRIIVAATSFIGHPVSFLEYIKIVAANP